MKEVDPSAERQSLEDTELLVLRAMCRGTPQRSVRAEAARILRRYAWREPVHQAMFNCLRMISAVELDDLRRTLLACLTRKGFPDVDLETFLEPRAMTLGEARQFIRGLCEPR